MKYIFFSIFFIFGKTLAPVLEEKEKKKNVKLVLHASDENAKLMWEFLHSGNRAKNQPVQSRFIEINTSPGELEIYPQVAWEDFLPYCEALKSILNPKHGVCNLMPLIVLFEKNMRKKNYKKCNKEDSEVQKKADSNKVKREERIAQLIAYVDNDRYPVCKNAILRQLKIIMRS